MSTSVFIAVNPVLEKQMTLFDLLDSIATASAFNIKPQAVMVRFISNRSRNY